MARAITRKPGAEQPEPKEKKWSDINGEMAVYAKVFVDDKGNSSFSYSVSVGRKQQNSDKYNNAYAVVFFKNAPDKVLDDFNPDLFHYRFKIMCEGFLTVYKDKIAVQIMQYEITEIEGKPVHEFPAPF